MQKPLVGSAKSATLCTGFECVDGNGNEPKALYPRHSVPCAATAGSQSTPLLIRLACSTKMASKLMALITIVGNSFLFNEASAQEPHHAGTVLAGTDHVPPGARVTVTVREAPLGVPGLLWQPPSLRNPWLQLILAITADQQDRPAGAGIAAADAAGRGCEIPMTSGAGAVDTAAADPGEEPQDCPRRDREPRSYRHICARCGIRIQRGQGQYGDYPCPNCQEHVHPTCSCLCQLHYEPESDTVRGELHGDHRVARDDELDTNEVELHRYEACQSVTAARDILEFPVLEAIQELMSVYMEDLAEELEREKEQLTVIMDSENIRKWMESCVEQSMESGSKREPPMTLEEAERFCREEQQRLRRACRERMADLRHRLYGTSQWLHENSAKSSDQLFTKPQAAGRAAFASQARPPMVLHNSFIGDFLGQNDTEMAVDAEQAAEAESGTDGTQQPSVQAAEAESGAGEAQQPSVDPAEAESGAEEAEQPTLGPAETEPGAEEVQHPPAGTVPTHQPLQPVDVWGDMDWRHERFWQENIIRRRLRDADVLVHNYVTRRGWMENCMAILIENYGLSRTQAKAECDIVYEAYQERAAEDAIYMDQHYWSLFDIAPPTPDRFFTTLIPRGPPTAASDACADEVTASTTSGGGAASSSASGQPDPGSLQLPPWLN